MATPLLLPEQVAERLQVSVATLKDWRYKNTGPAFLKVNRSVRYEPAVIDAYVEGLRPKSNVVPFPAAKSA